MADSPKQDMGSGSIKKRMVKMAALALVGQRYHCRTGDHLPVLPLLPQADENRTVNEKTALRPCICNKIRKLLVHSF